MTSAEVRECDLARVCLVPSPGDSCPSGVSQPDLRHHKRRTEKSRNFLASSRAQTMQVMIWYRMTKPPPEKTHQQFHNELRDAFNERTAAAKLKRHDEVEQADAKISVLRSKLPPPRGTKPRWK
jgi:spore maturation protein CgeB